MIEIDGSFGEGGGAILRQALGLAAYAGRAIHVTSIRAARRPPGLKVQHVKAVEAAAAICGASVEGALLGSTELTFHPGPLAPGTYTFEIGTAGATTLVLQALLVPCLCRADAFDFRLVGGTDVPWSPPADYLKAVTLTVLAPFGDATVRIARRGYYPKGGGVLEAQLRGCGGAPPIDLSEQGQVRRIVGLSHAAVALRARRVAERQAEAAADVLASLGVSVTVNVTYDDAYGLGSGVTLWTEMVDGAPLGASALGARGKRAEDVGREAGRALLAEIRAGAAVDRYLADQLVPFLGVAGGRIMTSEITHHTRSNIYVAEAVLGTRFAVDARTVSAAPP